ncbi:ribosome recycling factor [Oceanivirga salmonicida]|uniref:ribosome recycling factor n=1 Tax=Oceanivirga salmonicida TaxID=1769291 RepID=UPI0008366342|nr:ribosome recycling factor [Oceanivirga salmonicida]
MLEELMIEVEEKMKKTLDVTKEKFAHVRAGRANVSMIDGVSVDYFGQMSPLNQVASLSAPESRLIVIDPWDKSLIPAIEKEILKANLGFNPSNDGKIIRLVLPELTEERRKEYVKVVKKEAEDGKIAIRSIRKDANTKIKKMEKDSEISEDELKSNEDSIQKLTDKYVGLIDEVLSKKEKELMSI